MSAAVHLIRALTGAVLLLPGTAQAAPAQPTKNAPATSVSYGGPISRHQVIARAADWLRRGIQYSQNNLDARWDVNRGRRYRPDCSGFVSMAWALDTRRTGRALVTWELPAVSRPVGWNEMRRGDILLHLAPGNRAAEHVRLIQAWANPSRSRVWIIEQSGRMHDMRRRVISVAEARKLYRPYRYLQIR
ncbi:hypothetical protein [Actinoplanes sp. NPDC051494]|uniref:hypothetical protein n=1 Tax=Actinoplanes sp. NPDC051494 TaxID=3363907 RepID=UPI00379BBCEF